MSQKVGPPIKQVPSANFLMHKWVPHFHQTYERWLIWIYLPLQKKRALTLWGVGAIAALLFELLAAWWTTPNPWLSAMRKNALSLTLDCQIHDPLCVASNWRLWAPILCNDFAVTKIDVDPQFFLMKSPQKSNFYSQFFNVPGGPSNWRRQKKLTLQ